MSPNSPVLSAIYVLVGLTFIGVGSFILVETGKVVEVSKRYDDIDECKADWRTPRTCIIDIDIDEDMDSPIFFYYEIKNMYQNHRKYFKSRDILQLMGEDRSKSDIRSNCEPVVTMDDLGFYTKGLTLDDDSPANPCGLLAKSYFNDTFSLLKPDSDDEVYIDQHDIAWDVDKDDKFERSDDSKTEQWIDVENGTF
jgi:hypothetical protein